MARAHPRCSPRRQPPQPLAAESDARQVGLNLAVSLESESDGVRYPLHIRSTALATRCPVKAGMAIRAAVSLSLCLVSRVSRARVREKSGDQLPTLTMVGPWRLPCWRPGHDPPSSANAQRACKSCSCSGQHRTGGVIRRLDAAMTRFYFRSDRISSYDRRGCGSVSSMNKET